MTTLMNAALPASTTLALTSTTPALPAGLTDIDAACITAAIAAARTESTRTVYDQAWSQWERWCAARGIPALPGDPLALCAYLTERAEAGKRRAPSTSLAPPSDTSTASPASRTPSPPRPSGRCAAG